MTKIIIFYLISLMGNDDFFTRERATCTLKKITTIYDMPIISKYGLNNRDAEIRYRSKDIIKVKQAELEIIANNIIAYKALEIWHSKREITTKDGLIIKNSPSIRIYLTTIIAIELWYANIDYQQLSSNDIQTIVNCVNSNKKIRERKFQR